MHPNSLIVMQRLLTAHVPPERRAHCDIYDVGSYDVNGTYRPIVTKLGFRDYKGIDIEPGPNVDFVIDGNAAQWSLPQREVVISGQCLEHTRFFWSWFQRVVELTAPGGLIFIIAPWAWPEHRHPLDCWRILPDGMRVLAEWGGVDAIEVGRSNTPKGKIEGDAWGVFRK